jgi:hypothetical protein
MRHEVRTIGVERRATLISLVQKVEREVLHHGEGVWSSDPWRLGLRAARTLTLGFECGPLCLQGFDVVVHSLDAFAVHLGVDLLA